MYIVHRAYKLFCRPVINNVTQEDFDVKKTYVERTKGVEETIERFSICFQETQFSFFRTFLKVFWLRYVTMILRRLIETVLNIILPMLIFRMYLIFNEENRSSMELIRVLSVILTINVVDSFLNEMWWTDMSKWMNELKMCFGYALYKKSLRTSDCESSKEKLINLCENDLWKFCEVLNICSRLPDQLIRMFSTFVYFFVLLGPSAAVTVVAMFVILVPINFFGMKYAFQQEKNINGNSDKRIKIITEVVKTIRFIKSFVWEDIYEQKIKKVRHLETTARRKACVGWSFVELAWIMSTFVLSSCSWIVYVWLGYTFTASVCFTVVTLSGGMAPQVFSLANSFNEFLKAKLAADRVLEFMNLEEMEKDDGDIIMFEKNSEEEVICLKFDGCSFAWKESRRKEEEKMMMKIEETEGEGEEEEVVENNTNKPVLQDISFQVKEGEFIGITGAIGSGKTALVSSILGEMKCMGGQQRYLKNGIVSLFSQNHWVRSASIKENILFGSKYDKERYDAVIYSCALEDDMNEFSDGDETLVGENGVTLSGGQKARLCLARMAYVNEGVCMYVADDPVKDLDEGVAAHVMENVFMKLLKDKTRILLTHHVESLRHAQRVIILENGRIVKTGPPSEVLAGQLMTPTPQGEKKNVNKMGFPGFEDVEEDEPMMSILLDERVEEKKSKKKKKKKRKEEVVIRDKFDVKLLLKYLTDSKFQITCFFVLLISKLVLENLRDLGLGQWSSDDTFSSHSMLYYVLRDMLFGIVVGLIVITSMVLFSGYLLGLAEKYHNLMLKKLLSAPSTFFDVTMSGQILSRFASDVNILDNELRWRLREFIFCGVFIISTLFFVIYCCPMYVLVAVPLCTFVYFMVKKYVGIFVKVTRLSTREHAPMISHMNETNEGLVILRAFRKEEMFCEEMKEKLKLKVRLNFLENDLCFWMATRTRWSINLSILFFCLICIVMNVDGVYASMAISRIFYTQFLVTWVLYLIPGIQKCLASLERIVDYVNNLPCEMANDDRKSEENEGDTRPIMMEIDGEEKEFKEGEIEFKNVKFKYDSDEEDYILDDISFRVPTGSKLGIVGRTGSGKSTIVKTLFSLYEHESGEVLVHGRRREDWDSVKDLRNSMVYIAQNPTLLNGTLRENLDLTGAVHDNELWEVLNVVGLSQTLKDRLGLSLDSSLDSAGVKLSSGEKQLLCFGRALIKKKRNRILVLDEATSACDLETDRKIQEIVRKCFKDCTIIAIAHRLETIIQFDRILAIHSGKIVQNGKPCELLKKDDGLFFKMCRNTGRRRFEKLVMLASA